MPSKAKVRAVRNPSRSRKSSTTSRRTTSAGHSPATRNTSRQAAASPALLSGGNPQIAKAEGNAPVQAYLAAMPEWKRDVGRRLDALIARNVPDVRKAVKWNSPFYGVEGKGWST